MEDWASLNDTKKDGFYVKYFMYNVQEKSGTKIYDCQHSFMWTFKLRVVLELVLGVRPLGSNYGLYTGWHAVYQCIHIL